MSTSSFALWHHQVYLRSGIVGATSVSYNVSDQTQISVKMWSQSSQTPALEAINKHLLVQLRTASSCFPAKSCSHHVPVHSVISSLHHRPRRIWCDLTFMLKTVLWLRLQKHTAAWESESEGDTKQSPQAFALLIHPPGNTVNMEVYCNEPRSLRENIWHKPPTLWHRAPLSAFGCSLIHDAQREAPRVWFGTLLPRMLFLT